MFTGVIETLGQVRAIDVCDDVARLRIEAVPFAAELGIGDSVALNGVCLTVTEIEGVAVCFDAVRETLDRSALGALEVGSRVHLERAMRADGRFDGHIVQGHVDGVGSITDLRRLGDTAELSVALPPELDRYIVFKGSVCVDGISLTVSGLSRDSFTVALIPHALEVTNLRDAGVGDPVNLEADVIAKYVERLLQQRAVTPDGAP